MVKSADETVKPADEKASSSDGKDSSGKPEQKASGKSEQKAAGKPDPKAGAKPDPKAGAKSDPKVSSKSDPKADPKAGAKSDPKAGAKPDTKAGAKSDPKAPKAARATAKAPPPSRTPPDPRPVPVPRPNGEHDLSSPDYYLNRELTWLNFNFRVLHEAEDARTPLLERLKFLSIVSSNLDEFVMKRIGGLKQQVGAGVQKRTVDGRTPREQIRDCLDLLRELEERKRTAYGMALKDLRKQGIEIKTFDELKDADKEYLRDYYITNVYPLVTPQATDPAHPFPFISNNSLNLLVTLRQADSQIASLARVKVPVGSGTARFLKLGKKETYVTLESVMAHNLDLLFPGMVIESCELFRVTRNANTDLREDRADDLLALIETGLRERKFAPIVRMQVAAGMTPQHRGMLAAELGLNEETDVFEVEGLMAMRDLMEFLAIRRPDLRDPPHHPLDHPLVNTDRSLFHVIRDHGSILLHHPYDAFTTSVERFLREASSDPKVLAIKMSLYRTSAQSKAVGYLIDAARNGKQVAVVVELKARFDEEANIRWANRMEEAGIHVTYGVMGLKTHCKSILVIRRDYSGLRRYAHVGTGNYHAGTARLYSDLGMLTCDDGIGQDFTELFNYLTTGYKPKRKYRKILPAPKVLKPALLSKIQREIDSHSESSPGLIRFKMNALEDAEITRGLYRAAQAGVRVELIIRDSCRLRPGVPGLSESASVISIVGRFLEHTRVYYFQNGGDEEYFIGSADAMKRNLDSRVEVLAPVDDPLLMEELAHILEIQLGDRRSAWKMRPDGSYEQRHAAAGEISAGSQEQLIARAEERFRDATRLRRRKPRGIGARNGG